MPEAAVAAQPELPLAPPVAPPAPNRFVIPDDPTPPAAAESVPDAQNTGEQAPPATSEAKPEEEKLTPEQAAKRDGRRFERKLDKAYRQRAEAQARAELLAKELETVRQANAPKAPAGEPTLADFDYDPEKYAAAKVEFAKTQASKDFEAKQKQETARSEYQRLISSWEEKVEKAEDKYDDFRSVVGDLQPNNPFVAAVMHADNGDEVAYHLGKNPKEAQRIAHLPPLAQVFEIGKLAAKLSAEPVKPKAPSKAPAPITPVAGTAVIATSEPVETDNMDAWIRKRNKQVAAKR